MKKPLILQISIPFCIKQCSYCKYPYCRYDPSAVRSYTGALLDEISSYEDDLDDHIVTAIAIEGGSPALLGADSLQQVIRSVTRTFCCADDLQISLQTMPGDYSRALMEKMRDAGVNHYIIGLQTARRREHDLLARPYRFDAITMIDTAIRTFEPRALSFDVLTDIPEQDEHTLEQTLKQCLYYAPEHISLYPLQNLTADETRDKHLPLFTFADAFLKQMGYSPYTARDYTKNGHTHRYRELWLQGCETIGIGYHSRSYLDGIAWHTGHTLQEYLDHPKDYQITACAPVSLSQEDIIQQRRRMLEQYGNTW